MLKALLVRFWSTTLLLIRRWNDDECFTRSAAMAFYAAFSLFPLCLILMAVLGFVARFSQTAQTEQERLIQIVEEGTTPWIAAQLGHVLSQVQTKATVGGPLGLAILVVTALGMFAQLDSALDRIWRGPALNSPGF